MEWRPLLAAAAFALAGCAGTGTATTAADGQRSVTIEHDAALPADEVAARAMLLCRQAGKANAAFEAMVAKPPRLAAGSGAQLSTYRCTP